MSTATVTLDLYSFTDLPEESKDRAIDQWREVLSEGWDSHDVDMVTDEEYWRERAESIGFSPELRKNGEVACYWDTNPLDLAFSASIDVAEFLRSQKLAGKYRSLYNAAIGFDVSGEVTLRHRYGVPRGEVEIVYNGCTYNPARDNLRDEQASTVQDLAQSAYDTLCSDWVKSIDDAIYHHFSDENIREELSGFREDVLFREDGTLYG